MPSLQHRTAAFKGGSHSSKVRCMSEARHSLSVLVIDDDEIMRELLTALLEAEGHSVHAADSPSAGAAAAKAAAGMLNVVLTDLRMPGVDGPKTLRALRAAMSSTTRLLGMSGSDAEPEELGLLDGFLMKPFSVEDFTAAVKRARAGAPEASPLFQATPQRDAPVLDEAVYKRMAKSLPANALRELYELTLDDVTKRAAAMREAAAVSDSGTCRSEAHAMKGGCGMVGAMELRAIAADIETGAPVDTPALKEIAAATERLRRMLNALPL